MGVDQSRRRVRSRIEPFRDHVWVGTFESQDFHTVQTNIVKQLRNPFGRPLDFNGIEARCGYAWDSREIDQFFDCRIESAINGVEDFSGGRHGRAG
jgi:hypothetical protein